MRAVLILLLLALLPVDLARAQEDNAAYGLRLVAKSPEGHWGAWVTELRDVQNFDTNVVVRNMFTGQSKADSIDPEVGYARFFNLRPGPYTVSVTLTDTGNALGPKAEQRAYTQRRVMFVRWLSPLEENAIPIETKSIGAMPVFPSRFSCTTNFEACLQVFYEAHRDQICGLTRSNLVQGSKELRTPFEILASGAVGSRSASRLERERTDNLERDAGKAIQSFLHLSKLASSMGAAHGLDYWKSTLESHVSKGCYRTQEYLDEFAEDSLRRCESDREVLEQGVRFATYMKEVRASLDEVDRHGRLLARVCAMPRQHGEAPLRPAVGITMDGAVVQEIGTAEAFRAYVEFYGEEREIGAQVALRLMRPLRDASGNVTQRQPVARASLRISAADRHFWRGSETRLSALFPDARLRDGDELELTATTRGGQSGRTVIRVKATQGVLSGLRILNAERQPVEALTVGGSYIVQAVYEELGRDVVKSARVVAVVPGAEGPRADLDGEMLVLRTPGRGQTPNTREARLTLVAPRTRDVGLSAPAGSEVRVTLDGRALRLPVRAAELAQDMARLQVNLTDHQRAPLAARVSYTNDQGAQGSFVSGSSVDLPPGRYELHVAGAYAVPWRQQVTLAAGRPNVVSGPGVVRWTPVGQSDGGQLLVAADATTGGWIRGASAVVFGRAVLAPAGAYRLYRNKRVFSHTETILGQARRVYTTRLEEVGAFSLQAQPDGTAVAVGLDALFAPSLE